MQQTSDQPEGKRTPSLINSTALIVLGQVGCLVFLVIFLSMVVGLLLDKYFDTRPLFTILLSVGSAPLLFFLVLLVVKRAAPRLNANSSKGPNCKPEV